MIHPSITTYSVQGQSDPEVYPRKHRARGREHAGQDASPQDTRTIILRAMSRHQFS